MSYYRHGTIPDAKFEFSSSSAFRDVKGTSNQIWLFTPGYLLQENGSNLKKKSFYVQNRSSRAKVDPSCQFQQFPSREKCFHF